MLEALGELPCPVDLFVYTADELEWLEREGDAFVETVRATGRDLLE